MKDDAPNEVFRILFPIVSILFVFGFTSLLLLFHSPNSAPISITEELPTAQNTVPPTEQPRQSENKFEIKGLYLGMDEMKFVSRCQEMGFRLVPVRGDVVMMHGDCTQIMQFEFDLGGSKRTLKQFEMNGAMVNAQFNVGDMSLEELRDAINRNYHISMDSPVTMNGLAVYEYCNAEQGFKVFVGQNRHLAVTKIPKSYQRKFD